jgi:hypothetical protein
MDNLKIYNALKQPPKEALRQIQGGRLSGKTDINPQWRYKAMTEQFGMCGVGWKYEVTSKESKEASDGQVFAFVDINLYYKVDDKWSDPIPGSGGSMLVEKEKAGLHANDEGYKMATTDALSTAMKMLGVAADIYAGLWDGAKYRDSIETTTTTVKDTATKPAQEARTSPAPAPTTEGITVPQTKKIHATAKEKWLSAEEARAYMQKTFKKNSTKELTKDEASTMIEFLEEIKPDDIPLVRAAKELGAKEEANNV